MMYFLLVPVFTLLGLIPLNKRSTLFLGLVVISAYIIFCCLEYKVGVDWFLYKSKYDNYDSYDGITVEFGFGILMRFFSYLNISFFAFYFLLKIIAAVAIFDFIKKVTPECNVLLFVLFIALTTQLMIENLRQQFALIFLLYAVSALVANKKNLFLLLILCGSTFHITLLVTLPLYFIYRSWFLQSILVVLAIITFALSISHFDILTGILSIGKMIAPNSIAVTKLEVYLSYGGGSPLTIKHVFRNIFVLVVFYLYMKVKAKFSREGCGDHAYLNMLSISFSAFLLQVLYENLFYSSETMWVRISLYFVLFMLLSVFLSLKVIENKGVSYIIIFVVIIYSLHTMVDALTTDSAIENIIPAKNYLSYIVTDDHAYDIRRNKTVAYFWDTWEPAGASN
ncbi:EpsG family protein [Scandinavium sp. TWS1a]|uniref:EpsG family protein n=1 Tax=Scandinavium tedordense TaxID=2926521 RepID=UPI002165C421|nr:EpsG family protein [Scandinavium tedordense]MCS2171730.1 EpsG family protein [Scandinavium tedordense]